MISATIGNYVFSKYLCETKGRQILNTKFSKVLKVPPHLVKSKPHLKQLRELQNNYKLPKMLNPNTHKLISMQKPPKKKLFPLDPRKGMLAGKVQSSELSFSFKILFVSSLAFPTLSRILAVSFSKCEFIQQKKTTFSAVPLGAKRRNFKVILTLQKNALLFFLPLPPQNS